MILSNKRHDGDIDRMLTGGRGTPWGDRSIVRVQILEGHSKHDRESEADLRAI